MKVTSVDIFNMKPTKAARMPWNPVLVRVNTDEGVSGIGEVGLAYSSGFSAGAGMVRDLATYYLLGEDPMRVEAIWNKLFRSSFWGLGGGPVVYGGISAIDTALWDIRGKVLGAPIYQLLGGKTNERLRAYASQIQGGWSETPGPHVSPEQYAEAARQAVAAGFTAVKVDPLGTDEHGQRITNHRGVLPAALKRIWYQRVRAIREAVGPDVDILLEAHAALSTTSAIQMGRLWEDLDCYFYEEPLHSLNPDALAKVAQNVRIPIAAGERIYTRWGFSKYFALQALDIIQPDIGLVGGITEAKKVCDMAHASEATVQCHVCGTAVATAASLHLEAAIPNFAIHEHHLFALQDMNKQVIKQDLQPKNGFFEIPEGPGLGVDLNEEFMAQFDRQVVS